jgi:hypothetical protein
MTRIPCGWAIIAFLVATCTVSAVVAQTPGEDDPCGLGKVADVHGVARFDQGNIVGKVTSSIGSGSRAGEEPEERGERELSHLEKLLRRDQMTRFEQLHCQREGPPTLRFPRYAERVGLDAANRGKIQSLVAEYRERSKPMHRQMFVAQGVEEVPALGRRLLDLERDLDEQLLARLTEPQRGRWVALLGEKYPAGESPCEVAAAPDGSRLAYRGVTALGSFVGLMSPRGAERVRLTDLHGLSRCASFAPDGKRLVFSTLGEEGWDLHLVDADGADDRALQLSRHVPDEGARFTADGAALVFGTRKDGIFEYSIARGDVRRILPRGHRPAVSPDGRVIVYEESPYRPDDPGSSALFMVHRDGTRDRDLGIPGSDVQVLADGTIAFLSGEALHREVWRMNLDGSARRRITASDEEKAPLCVTANGTKLLFLRSALYPGTAFRSPFTLYEMNLHGNGLTAVAELW